MTLIEVVASPICNDKSNGESLTHLQRQWPARQLIEAWEFSLDVVVTGNECTDSKDPVLICNGVHQDTCFDIESANPNSGIAASVGSFTVPVIVLLPA
jgi:hypothetical protein